MYYSNLILLIGPKEDVVDLHTELGGILNYSRQTTGEHTTYPRKSRARVADDIQIIVTIEQLE